jgi:hypothetical protein
MDPLVLGALVGVSTIVVLFSGVSVAIGLLVVSAGFLIAFDGVRSLELMPEIFLVSWIVLRCYPSPCLSSWEPLSPQLELARICTKH